MKKNNLGAKAEFYEIISKNWNPEQVAFIRERLKDFVKYQESNFKVTEQALYFGLISNFYRVGKDYQIFIQQFSCVYTISNYTLKSLKEQDTRMNLITVLWNQLYEALDDINLHENHIEDILGKDKHQDKDKDKEKKEETEKEAKKRKKEEKRRKRIFSAIVNAIFEPYALVYLQETELEEYKDQLSLKEFLRYYEDDSHSQDPVQSLRMEYGNLQYNPSVVTFKSKKMLAHFKDEFFSYFQFRYGMESYDVDRRIEFLKERRSSLLKQIKYRFVMVFIHYKLITQECGKNTSDTYIYVDSKGKKIQVPNCLCAFIYDFFLKKNLVKHPQIQKTYSERSDAMVKLRNFTSDEVDTTLPKFDTTFCGICMDLALSKGDKSFKNLIFGPRSGMS